MSIKIHSRNLALAFCAATVLCAPVAALAQPYGDSDRQAQYEDQQRQDRDRQDRDRQDRDRQDQYRQEQYRQAQYQEQRRAYDAQYGNGAYDRYQENQARRACRDKKKNAQVGGAILGGIAGALIGNGVSRGGGREGGTIIGGVGGAAVGSSIAKGETKCD